MLFHRVQGHKNALAPLARYGVALVLRILAAWMMGVEGQENFNSRPSEGMREDDVLPPPLLPGLITLNPAIMHVAGQGRQSSQTLLLFGRKYVSRPTSPSHMVQSGSVIVPPRGGRSDARRGLSDPELLEG